jgi:hypothetical protein
MGAISNLFGLGYATTDEQMGNFVDSLVNGFALDAPTNSTVMDDLGTVFVESLSNSTHRRCMSEADKDGLKDSFLVAVAQSSAAIKRKRNSKRRQSLSKMRRFS